MIQLDKAIVIVPRAAMKFYQATKGKRVDKVDMPTFFKSQLSSLKEFVA